MDEATQTRSTAVAAVSAMASTSCQTGTSPDAHLIGIASGAVSGNIDRATPQPPFGSDMTADCVTAGQPVQTPEVGDLVTGRHTWIESAFLRHVAPMAAVLLAHGTTVVQHLASVG